MGNSGEDPIFLVCKKITIKIDEAVFKNCFFIVNRKEYKGKSKHRSMKKNYLSKEGYEKLDKELRDLKTRGRREIAEEISEARAKGDLSENAEYDAAKEAQGHLESRIAELENTLATSSIIDEKNIDDTKAYLLSTVTILNHNTGKEMEYTLVSKDEADFKEKKISVDSPIGQGILGKEVGDVVEVKVPAGKLKLEVKKIERR